MHQVVRQDGVFRPPIRELGFVLLQKEQGILLLVLIAVLTVKLVLLLVVFTVKVALTVVQTSVYLFQ